RCSRGENGFFSGGYPDTHKYPKATQNPFVAGDIRMPPVMYQQVSNETDLQQNPYLCSVSSFEYFETKREVSLPMSEPGASPSYTCIHRRSAPRAVEDSMWLSEERTM